MTTKIPIVFVHRSNSFYLASVLKQAKKSNPDCRIILLGDSTNNKYSFVEHYDISDYFEEAQTFATIYQHHSPNGYDYELFCFQRWFVINEFFKKNCNLTSTGFCCDSFFYCDTDTLLFDNINEQVDVFKKYDFTTCRTGTPCFTFFNEGVIKDFCNFIISRYSTSDGKKLIQQYVETLKAKKRRYGISDMTAFVAFENSGKNVLHLDFVWGGVESYLHNYTDVNDGYKMINGVVDARMRNGYPYAFYLPDNKWVRFKGMHFQGSGKKHMYKYLPLWRAFLFRIAYYQCRLRQKTKNLFKKIR